MDRITIFENILENKHLRDINPVECGEEQCGSIQSYGPRARDYYLLHYIISGRGTYKTPTQTFEVGAGQIFVIRPHEMTTYSSNRKDPWRYCWVGFESSLDLSSALSSYVLTAPECENIFLSIARYSNIGDGREWYICGKIYELLGILNTQYNHEHDQELRYVRTAQSYIEARYNESVKVSAIANRLNLDRTHFSKLFRKHTGKSPQEYIVDFRLEKAAHLLVQQGLSPGEVAYRVGYSDIYSFSKMFSRKYGLSPNQYKKAKLMKEDDSSEH